MDQLCGLVDGSAAVTSGDFLDLAERGLDRRRLLVGINAGLGIEQPQMPAQGLQRGRLAVELHPDGAAVLSDRYPLTWDEYTSRFLA